jgi:hypothetical protein
MRHSDARITLGMYGHPIGNAQREAVEEKRIELSAVNQLEPSRRIGADIPISLLVAMKLVGAVGIETAPASPVKNGAGTRRPLHGEMRA